MAYHDSPSLKIVLLDLETLPNLSEALKVWPQLSDYPGKTLRATITSIICGGWKLLDDKKVNCINAWDFPNWEVDVNDDSLVCEALFNVLHNADAVITHNGKRFDWKYLQTRLRVNNLPALPRIPHIDTKELASKNLFAFNNRLNHLGRMLTQDEKLEHEGWALWVKVWHKDKKALKDMAAYCKQDVLLLEKLFNELKPFATNLPNRALFTKRGEHICPNCASTRMIKWGYHNTKTTTYQRYRCKDCGSYARTDKRDALPRSV